MRAHTAWGAAALLLVAHGTLALLATRRIGLVTDEAAGLAGGFEMLTARSQQINFEHPPLVKTIAALPLLGTHPPFDPATARVLAARPTAAGKELLFGFPGGIDAALLRCRAMVLVFSLLLAGAIFGVTASIHGRVAGLLALSFYAFDPAFLGHGPLVALDVPLSLFVFASCMTFHAALTSGSLVRFAVAGLLLGLGLGTKLTALFILPLWIVLAVFERGGKRLLVGALLAFAVAAFALSACYGFVLVPDFVRGLAWQARHARHGHVSYLFGRTSTEGFWLYFPVMLALKTPLETLVALGFALALAIRAGISRRAKAALLCAAAFFVLLLPSSIGIGHRYMLPVYPFLWVVIGSLASVGRGWSLQSGSRPDTSRRVGAALAALLALRSLVVFPSYIGFTNALATSRPERIMADSNLDYGQELPELARWLAARGNPEIGLAYTGFDEPEARGIRYHRTPCTRMPGLHAASINAVVGILPAWNRSCYIWLQGERVVARIGTSMLVFEVP